MRKSKSFPQITEQPAWTAYHDRLRAMEDEREAVADELRHATSTASVTEDAAAILRGESLATAVVADVAMLRRRLRALDEAIKQHRESHAAMRTAAERAVRAEISPRRRDVLKRLDASLKDTAEALAELVEIETALGVQGVDLFLAPWTAFADTSLTGQCEPRALLERITNWRAGPAKDGYERGNK